MNTIFYIFVVTGVLFYLYLLFAYLVDKKRDVLILDLEKNFSRSNFKKCPHCGVLNLPYAKMCEFCKRKMPVDEAGEPGEETPPPPLEPPPEESPPPETSTPPKGPDLKKFPYSVAWPLLNPAALISVTGIYLAVILIYGFFAGVYALGKKGVEQIDEISIQAAKQRASRQTPAYETYGQKLLQPPTRTPDRLPVRTPTPMPSPTPFSLAGSLEEQITQLMLHLENEDWNVSRQARKKLVEIGKPAAKELAKEVDHPDPMVRTHVISALGEIGDPVAADALIGLLERDDPVTVILAATALGRIGTKTCVRALEGILDHPDWRIRRAAVLSLAESGDSVSVKALLPLVEDDHEKVREAASKAVEKLKEKE